MGSIIVKFFLGLVTVLSLPILLPVLFVYEVGCRAHKVLEDYKDWMKD